VRGVVADGFCFGWAEAGHFSSSATWSSSSAIRAAALADRLASLFLVRNVALTCCRAYTRARSSSLLGLGTVGDAAGFADREAGALARRAGVFAGVAAGRPGLRADNAALPVDVGFVERAISLSHSPLLLR